MSPDSDILLRVDGLSTRFLTDEGVARAVENVSFEVPRGRTVALVGESGCGKTVTALSILRLVPDPPGRIVAGRVLFDGVDLPALPESEMRHVRGNRMAMIFQEPMTSLNPVFTVGDQIAEAVMLHARLGRGEAGARAVEMLRQVGIADPESRAGEYPHQMSGGMRQRVMIAMALVCGPRLLIADEPTTALDVTIQAQILDLLADLRRRIGMSILLITHDLGVVAEISDYVCVMYAGRIVERAEVQDLFDRPRHPYTVGLFRSRPTFEVAGSLATIPGTVPNPVRIPPGCPFHPRCPLADANRCRTETPPLAVKDHGRSVAPHMAACWHSDRLVDRCDRKEPVYS